MSKQKEKGTRFETQIVQYLRRKLHDERVERRALHGTKDMGDIYGLYAHGYHGIIEAKNYKAYTPSLIEKFKNQTSSEKANADADFAVLVCHTPNVGLVSFGLNTCYITLTDLVLITQGLSLQMSALRDAYEHIWVQLSLETLVDLISGNAIKEVNYEQ